MAGRQFNNIWLFWAILLLIFGPAVWSRIHSFVQTAVSRLHQEVFAIWKNVLNCRPARAQPGEEAGLALHRRRRPQGEACHLRPEARERLSGDKIGILNQPCRFYKIKELNKICFDLR